MMSMSTPSRPCDAPPCTAEDMVVEVKENSLYLRTGRLSLSAVNDGGDGDTKDRVGNSRSRR